MAVVGSAHPLGDEVSFGKIKRKRIVSRRSWRGTPRPPVFFEGFAILLPVCYNGVEEYP